MISFSMLKMDRSPTLLDGVGGSGGMGRL